MPQKYNGKVVIDAVTPHTLLVKACDINTASKGNPMTCAVARCIMRTIRGANAQVGRPYNAYIEFANYAMRYAVRPEDREKIRAFDLTGVFQPCLFILMPPPPKKVSGPRKRKSTPASAYREVSKRRTPLRRVGHIGNIITP